MSTELPEHDFIPGAETRAEKRWNEAGKRRALLEAAQATAQELDDYRNATWKLDRFLADEYATAQTALLEDRQRTMAQVNARTKATEIMAELDREKTIEEMIVAHDTEKALAEAEKQDKAMLLEAVRAGTVNLGDSPEAIEKVMGTMRAGRKPEVVESQDARFAALQQARKITAEVEEQERVVAAIRDGRMP
jgi:hypothetical protein